MTEVTVDTLKYAEALKSAGVPGAQAEGASRGARRRSSTIKTGGTSCKSSKKRG